MSFPGARLAGGESAAVRAWTEAGTRALFSVAGDTCHLLAGDLRALLGVELSETDALVYAVDAWNASLGSALDRILGEIAAAPLARAAR